MNRISAALVSLVVCGTVFSPVREGFRERPKDDFPLSWFPMFARKRPAVETPVYVVAIDASGARAKVAQNFWTSGGFNQGATQLLSAGRAGPAVLNSLCVRVARNVARSRRPELVHAEKLQILRGRYSRETFFGEDDRTPIDEKTLATCTIDRSGR